MTINNIAMGISKSKETEKISQPIGYCFFIANGIEKHIYIQFVNGYLEFCSGQGNIVKNI